MKIGLKKSVVGLLLAAVLAVLSAPATCQEPAKRKILDHAAPAYPALARTMALQGIVKVDALVQADGSVKTAEVRGGHPVLAQAAIKAVLQWKWEPAGRESHELVEVKFAPE
jgi:TonB family protein